MITVNDLRKDKLTLLYIERANDYLNVLSYTSHGLRHVTLASDIARNVLLRLDYPKEEAELAAVAAFLHDIGNVCGRDHHEQSGALLARDMLQRLKMPEEDILRAILAIGNHEERTGSPVSTISAATILGDKTDVHRSRVQTKNPIDFDIHDKVNYAVTKSFLDVNSKDRTITLKLTIDIKISGITEYFQIFLDRVLMAQKAAAFLKTKFALEINGSRFL